MKFKKNTKNALVVFAVMVVLSSTSSKSNAAIVWDGKLENIELVSPRPTGSLGHKMKFDPPTLSISGDYEQKALSNTKIDDIVYPSYLKVNSSGTTSTNIIKDYPNNTAWGLKMNARGFLYYSPNLQSGGLTVADENKGVKTKTPGMVYSDYPGDLYWNYAVVVSERSLNDDAGKIGAFDLYKNFKPATYDDNGYGFYPLDLKYPTQFDPNLILGKKNGVGQSVFRGETVGKSSTYKYAGRIKWRNNKIKQMIGTGVVKGEWRFLGANTKGEPIGNSKMPADLGNSSTSPPDMKKNWQTYKFMGETMSSYNTSNDPLITKARNTTFSRFKTQYGDSGIASSEMAKYFNIQALGTKHVTGGVKAYYKHPSGGYRYNEWDIKADKKLDVEMSKVRILYGDRVIYTMTQTTNDLGVVGTTTETPASGAVKLQPGIKYDVEVTLRNRSGKDVYNPTINILGAKGANATNKDYEILDKGSNADAFWTYTHTSLQQSKNFGGSTVTSSGSRGGYFSVNGSRLKKNSSTGQKDTPAIISDQVLKAGKTITFKVPLTITEPSSLAQLKSIYGADNPNNVRVRLGVGLNSKHKINDAIFRGPSGSALGFEGVSTSVDDLYTDNNGVAMSRAFYSQDLEIGSTKEFELYDSKGKKVANNVVIKGEKYKAKILVKNPSTLFATGANCKSKIDYTFTDIGKSSKIGSGHGYGTRPFETNDSQYATFEFTVPENSSNSLRLDMTLSNVHENNLEDWYKGNNSVSVVLRAEPKVDLTIGGAMDETTSNGVTKVSIFKGETIGLRVQASSNVNHTTKSVQVKIDRRGESTATRTISSLDANNPQTIIYRFKGNEAKKYYVDVYIDPNNKVGESNEDNNKHTFEITVLDDEQKYASASHINSDLRSDGNIQGQDQKISSKYDSVTPAVVLKRRDKEYTYDASTNTFKESWGEAYDYRLEIPEATLDLDAYEEVKFEEILFKSKYTTDRWAANKDRDIIDSSGYVNLLNVQTVPTNAERLRYQQLAKVKAGYGFELIVKTSYNTDLKERYNDVSRSKGSTMVDSRNNKTVNTFINSKLASLRSKLPDSSFTVTDDITFFPEPVAVTVNANNQTLGIKMKDGRFATTIDTSDKLIEKTSGGSTAEREIYENGMIFTNEFYEKNDGLGGNKRIYYLGNDVPNGYYHIRIGTSKIGVGGIVNAPKVYKSNERAYAATDIKIQVYGARQEDLVDN